MPSAEIITIGTEILLGEIVDTNARKIALKLRDTGVDLYRKTTVGDNARRIAHAVGEALARCDLVITTGGLGPTVDDPTREAIALAFGVETEFQPELWEQIRARFRRFGRLPTENNRRQAYIPQGATPIENPVGTAPAFIMERDGHAVFALPGVPSEMEYLLEHALIPFLRARYPQTSVIKARLLHTAGVGESQIDDLISDLETLSNPTVGLAAHSGQVDVRITAKADSEQQASILIGEVEGELRRRLGRMIYGADEETLEGIALENLRKLGWTLAVVESNIGGFLINRLSGATGEQAEAPHDTFVCGEVVTNLASAQDLLERAAEIRSSQPVDVVLGLAVFPGLERQDIQIALVTPTRSEIFSRPYGGPPEYAPRWAVHHGLDLLRTLRSEEGE